MQLKPVMIHLEAYPDVFHPFLKDTVVFDSSSSKEAQVLYIPKKQGYFLKKATSGNLAREAVMTNWLHEKGVAPEVLMYLSCENDYLLTRKVVGDDCTAAHYLANPKRLIERLAENARWLHNVKWEGCPSQNRTQELIETAQQNFTIGRFDKDFSVNYCNNYSALEAIQLIREKGRLLETITLIHGDYCLPNILLNDWQFASYIDVDHSGLGDRHIDLFWLLFSLKRNLKTEKYQDYFLDAYGRDRIDPERLKIVAAIETFG